LKHGRKIAVIGLGYVGLPVAVAFARSGVPVTRSSIIDRKRVEELIAGHDRTLEVDPPNCRSRRFAYASDPASLKDARLPHCHRADADR
jgi:UDP-N-acetyl-D-galactosamine dehydrogenase